MGNTHFGTVQFGAAEAARRRNCVSSTGSTANSTCGPCVAAAPELSAAAQLRQGGGIGGSRREAASTSTVRSARTARSTTAAP